MNKKQKLAEIQAMIKNMHEQPLLSDSVKNVKFVWVFEKEKAVIKTF